MARFAYFADMPDGSVLEFVEKRERAGVDRYGYLKFREIPARVAFMRLAGDDRDYLYGRDQERGYVRITRKVRLKAHPSMHECDPRCMNANGRTMNCECSCGGRNHGRGRFNCTAA